MNLPEEEIWSERRNTLALEVLVPNSYMWGVCVCVHMHVQTCKGVVGEVGRKPGYYNVISGDVAEK